MQPPPANPSSTVSLIEGGVQDTGTKLRIALVAARYFPYMGGTETHVHEVSRRMQAAGHDVTILTSDATHKLPAHEVVNGVQVRRFRAYPREMDFYFAPAVYNAVAKGNWDVVHIQGYHTFVAPMAMLAAWRHRIPYVVTFHSGGHSSGWRNRIRGLQWAILRPLFAHATRLIGVSDFEADFFSKQLHIPRERFTVVPNGAQLPKAPEGFARDPEPLILSVGRLERYKGHHRVIRAMPNVLKAFPTARLRVVGAGPYEATLREVAQTSAVKDQVEIGAIPPSDRQGMAALMTRAWLVTLISDYEAHPVAVMEAVALGRPVLVSDVAGTGELAQRGLCPSVPLDATDEQIGAAIIEQLHHPFVASAQLEFPTWESCTKKLLDVYHSMVGK